MDVAAFVNRCWSRAFFTSMFGRYLFSSCVGSHTSSAFLVTLTDHPVIPFAMNYNIIKVLNNISIIVIQSVPIITFPIIHGSENFSPGHSTSIHSSISSGWPVQVPPLSSSTSLTLVLVLVPTPHSAEQAPTTHSSHSQWITKKQSFHHRLFQQLTLRE